nr:4'-phosphopantetheinyl transferase superfamily protein [Roseibium sp. CAU 1639]
MSDREPATDPGAWRFEADATGKPQIRGRRGPDFSLTHTRGLVACAVATAGRVGIDAETDGRSADVDLLLPEVCSPPERAALIALTGAARRSLFLDFWTLKEAYLKAQGLGISEDLTAIAFFVESDTDIRLETSGAGHRADWSLRIYRIGAGGRVALAFDGGQTERDIEVRRPRTWRD